MLATYKNYKENINASSHLVLFLSTVKRFHNSLVITEAKDHHVKKSLKIREASSIAMILTLHLQATTLLYSSQPNFRHAQRNEPV